MAAQLIVMATPARTQLENHITIKSYTHIKLNITHQGIIDLHYIMSSRIDLNFFMPLAFNSHPKGNSQSKT